MDMEAFWNKPSVKVVIKTTWKVVSICEVLWSARLNTSKVTGNRQEDRSSQWEATTRSVGLSTARVVGAHRDRYQRRWTATVRHLICVNVRRMRLDGSDRNSDRHRNTCWRLKSSEDRRLQSCERSARCINPCTTWSLSIWRSCAGPSPTSRGAVTSALQRVNFYSHLAITYQRMDDEPFLMLVHLPGILFQNICGHLIWHLTALGTC